MINYNINWKQTYDNWPSLEWLNQAQEACIEQDLSTTDTYVEAKEIIERIMNL